MQLWYDEDYYPCIFLVVGRIAAIPSGMEYCSTILIYCLNQSIGCVLGVKGMGNFKGFHLAFPNRMALTPHVREPEWCFCQLLNVATVIMHSGTKETTTDGLWVGPTVSWTWARTPFVSWPSNLASLIRVTWQHFESSGISTGSASIAHKKSECTAGRTKWP